MTAMNIAAKRRKHERYNVPGGISIHSAVNKGKTGQVINIGIGGLKVRYDDQKNSTEPWQWRIRHKLMPRRNSFYNISITTNGEECGLNHIPCKTVVDEETTGTSHPGHGILKCLEFGTLRHDQTFYIRKLIRHCSGRPVKDRRQLVDRRRNDSSSFPGSAERRKWWRNRRMSLKPLETTAPHSIR